VDTVGAAVMDFNPKKAEHLTLAAKKGLGICDLDKIRVLGEPIEKVKKRFKPSFSMRILSRFA